MIDEYAYNYDMLIMNNYKLDTDFNDLVYRDIGFNEDDEMVLDPE